MEQRLIDANKLERWLKTNMANENPLHCDIKETYSECITMVHCMETVDAVPVVHGRWVYDRPNHYKCSECDAMWSGIVRFMNFCPNCGAKMGDQADED